MNLILTDLEAIVREAGVLALDYFHDLKHSDINKKSPRDLVTAADLAVETFLKNTLTEKYPDYGFWGEEFGQTANQKQRWVVDPIDGTHSFSKGQYFWAISVALEIDAQVVLAVVFAPALHDLYSAERGKGARKNGKAIAVSQETELAHAMVATGFACLRSYLLENNLPRFSRIAQCTMGQRRFGSAALDLCLVADGQLDAYWEQELNLYDVAAGALIAEEAGASITDFQGNVGIFPEHILATNGHLLTQLLPLM